MTFWCDDGDDYYVRFILDRQTEFDFYSASSLKQQSACKHVASLGHIILVSELTSLYSYFSMQRV